MNELIEFVLERSDAEPLDKRARIIAALSRIVGDPDFAKRLASMSDALLSAHQDSHQLLLDFRNARTHR